MASILDLVRHYQRIIEKCHPKDEDRVLKSIDKLFSLDVKVQHLQETGVGRTVNALRKEPGMVGKAARALVYKWKLMVAAEESDQEDDHNDSSTQNGSGKESDDDKTKGSYAQMNGNHSGTKRKYHSSDDEPDTKKRKNSHSSDSEDKKKKHNQVKTESESDSEDSDSQSDSDESESSEEETKPVVVKQEPEDKPSKNKRDEESSKHSHRNNHIKSESSTSKSCESTGHDSRHSAISSQTKHGSEKTSKSSQISKDKHSKGREHSTEKKHNDNSDKEKSKDKEESRSSSKHSSDKHRSSSHKLSSSAEKHNISPDKYNNISDKHSSPTDKHNSSADHHSSFDKHKSSSEKHKSENKTKSDRHSSSKSDKEKHKKSEKDSSSKHRESSSSKEKSSSSKENSKHKNVSDDKDKSSHSKKDKSHRSDRDKSESDSRSKSEKNDNKTSSSSEKRSSKENSSSKSKHSSSKSKEDKPKKNVTINTDSDNEGIGCESGASFAEALGMVVPTKTKKKQSTTPIKDAFSPNNSLSNDCPAALLAPSAKLAPLPALEISALPEISPNYKPRPPPKFMPHFTEEELGAAMSSKNQRTKVYSGNKILGKVPTLYEMCVQILQEHIDALEYTGGVPYEILKPVVDKATPQQLFVLEHYNPYLMEDTDHLWQKHCERTFRNKKRQEMETWREMYMRCQEEQEHKLKSLTANIRMTQEAKKAPIKQTKMAYVDSVVKPPRNIARKQAQHGTAHMATASPAARVAALAAAPNVLKGGVRAPPAPPTSHSALNKPKKAPLMAKALQLMRGRKR